ncbi:MAG: hypothetical protein ABIT70_00225, partial [Sulfuriferula sp.]
MAMRIFFIFILLLLTLSACSKHTEPAVQLQPALVYTVTANGNNGTTVYSGEIHARHEADIGFRV